MIDSFTISDEKFINNEYFAKLETTFNKRTYFKIFGKKKYFSINSNKEIKFY